MIEAVIFDKDGVIIDSEKIHVESVRRALKELGFEFRHDDARIIVGLHPKDYKEALLKKYPVNWEPYRKRQHEIYYEILSDKSAVKEIINLIRELKRRGFKLGVATSAGKNSTDKILKMIGIAEVFDAIVTVEDCKARKPSPEPYLKAAEALRVSPEKCLVIEDTSTGLRSAKAAGMKCVIIKTNDFIEDDYSKADMVLNQSDINFENMRGLIEGY